MAFCFKAAADSFSTTKVVAICCISRAHLLCYLFGFSVDWFLFVDFVHQVPALELMGYATNFMAIKLIVMLTVE
jgi:hypothetical protein